MPANVRTKSNLNIILPIIKGAFWGVAFSLLCILIFAFVLKYTNLSENTIQPINQVIKGLSLLVACFVASKKISKNGWLVGILIGLVYTILTYIIFSILNGGFSFGISLLYDCLFGTIGGLIAGIICISLLKK